MGQPTAKEVEGLSSLHMAARSLHVPVAVWGVIRKGHC
jgi:hypothetical protein